jgi:hypothetical protein
LKAREIIDYARAHPDHPVSVSPANWAALVELFDSQAEQITTLEAGLKAYTENFEQEVIKGLEQAAEIERLNSTPHLDLTQSEVGRLFDALTFADDKEMEITDLWNKLEDYGEAKGYFEPKLPEPEEVEQEVEEVK